MLLFCSLFIVQFFLCFGRVSVCTGALWFTPGWLGERHMMLGAHLFGLLNVSHAGLELAVGGSSPSVFSV
jgi:hypothetical protein